ncbi:piggyBac transposable element-derived protein 5-like [Gigantopelta aegis]|uniref:piggyBac transposable element-derived protein 5-like n=1 Tax=Gigantopelta aegis TaxID=1735272 RepID=UPI001B887E11|nr:piggyBac transposable element-derived protein 5-like [Gigantopelta aegis]
MENGGFFYSENESTSDFDGFTNDDLPDETFDLDERYNSSDVDLSSDSDDLPLSRLRNGHNRENGNEEIEPETPNRTTSWSPVLTDIQVDAFVQPVGAVNILGNDAKEIDFFEQIFPDEWYVKIAQETNRYAQSRIEQNGDDPKWFATNADEIRAFIGFNILMGIVIAPTQDMYFSMDAFFRPTGMSDRITRDRFDKLCQYFHVCDISTNPDRGQPGHDKLAHVRPFLEAIRVQCRTQYSPHCETSIDEAMVAYTGRLSIKQYLP